LGITVSGAVAICQLINYKIKWITQVKIQDVQNYCAANKKQHSRTTKKNSEKNARWVYRKISGGPNMFVQGTT
jgi:hypothetical protein